MNFVSAEIESYAAAHTTPAADIYQQLAEETRAATKSPQMQIGPVEGALLSMIVKLAKPLRALEIGTFTGYSALRIAESLPEDGRLTTCEIDPAHAAIARKYFDQTLAGRKIDLKLGPALTTVQNLHEPLDFVFIDADKANYSAYYDAVTPWLRLGGLIVADNVLWSGRVLDPKDEDSKAIAAFNERVRRDSRMRSVMLTVRDGISVIQKVT
jgi:caffeoyl-CoA O-methyltransferase